MVGCLVFQFSSPHLFSGGFNRRRRCYLKVKCELTKQGERFLSTLAAAEAPSSSINSLLRKFVASSSKHVALNTLSHLLSPSTSHPRLSSFAYPLYNIIKQESWFDWNTKLMADLIAFLYFQRRLEEADNLLSETVFRLRFRERDLSLFYCHLLDSHAKHKSMDGMFDICSNLSQLMLQSSSLYIKQKGSETMIRVFCEMGLPDKAENLIENLTAMGLKPSAFSLRCLIYGYGQLGCLEDMKRCVLQMEDVFDLDTVCCNMVLSSFGSYNKLQDMTFWLKKMRNSSILLSIRSYNSALNSCPTVLALLEDLKNIPLSIKELVDVLKEEEESLVVELLKSSVLDQVMEWNSLELKLDLHGMHLATAYLVLLQWFDELKLMLAKGNWETPMEVLVVCGSGKHSSKRGESPVKGLAKEMMIRLRCPLRIDRKNVGCFIAKGKIFKDWLCS